MNLIDREALMFSLVFSDGTGNIPCEQMKAILEVVKALPLAQPKIVHCKDCKWSDWYDAADGHRYCHCMETGAAGRTADDFCSYAECKEVSG